MIQDVFLPHKYGTYYLFSSRIVGIEINATEVIATQVRAQGTTRIIEKIITIPLSSDIQLEHHARATEAVKLALEKVDRYTELITVIPSAYVIFKRITVPFIEPDKITQMISFEVEPLLPFPLSAAVIDFIITATAPDKKSAEVMVAAAQKERIVRHLALFESIGVQPTAITVDLLSLYAITKRIPSYSQLKGIVALIHIGTNATGIAFMHDERLIMVRTLAKGTTQIAKAISTARATSVDAALEDLLRFGIEKTDNTQRYEATRNALRVYLQEIAFTFTSATTDNARVTTTLMLGASDLIPGLLPYAVELLQTPCQLFDIMHVLEDTSVKLKPTVQLIPQAVLSLSAALPTHIMATFNLHPTRDQAGSATLFIKQIFTALTLLILMLGTLGTHSYLQKRALNKEAAASEAEVVAALKGRFSQIDSKQIARAIEDATEELAKEESTWFAFSSGSRASMLKILLELKTKIDKDALGFVIDSLTITESSLIMKASVKDHDALKQLEQALRTSPLFKYIEPQSEPTFEMKITLASSTGKEA
jgi:type IV pilus assembly protein PilM